MKFILSTLIFTLGVFSPYIYDNIPSNDFQIFIFTSIFLLLGFVTYRFRFKRNSHFKLFLFRNYIRIKKSFGTINKNLSNENDNTEQTPLQVKSIKLWKLLLKDEDSRISCSLINKIRQIEKDNMLLILSPINEQDFQLTIMDVDETKSCLYEVSIFSKISTNLIETFDVENEKRMNLGQSEKRESISNDLDKLITEQIKSLNKRTNKI